MTLLRSSIDFVHWLIQVVTAFIKVKPLNTVAIILMSASSHVLHILVFLMPLKVLMLAGSSGVPSRLSFFIQPEQKVLWIYILTGASVASYILMLLFDSLKDKLSLAGSQHLLTETEAIPLFENQKSLAQSYYVSFSQLSADILFVSTAFLTGLFIYFQFFAFLIFALASMFLLSCTMVRSPEKSMPGTFSYYLRESYNSYLSVLSSIFFLAAFIFLLIPFLFYDNINFLLAIASFIILRRTLSTIRSGVKNAIKLFSQRHRINALIFPHVQLQEEKKPEELAFFEFFNQEARKKHAFQALKQVMSLDSELEILWEDFVVTGVNTFVIEMQNNSLSNSRYFKLNVFPPKQTMKLDNEDFLFTHIPRHHIMAPGIVTLYVVGQFQCQILEYGTGSIPKSSQWQEIQDLLLERLWSYPPPHELVRACCASMPMLYDRLSPEFVSQLKIATDSEQEKQTLQAFLDHLSSIRSRLKKMPLHIYNPELKKNNVVLGKEQQPYIMFWGKWSLEPIGVDLPVSYKKKEMSDLVNRLSENRKDLPVDYSENDIFLVAKCWDLELSIKKKKYKYALELLAPIIDTCSQIRQVEC